MTKAALRASMRRLRRGLGAEQRQQAAEGVQQRLLAALPQHGGAVFVYVSVRAELDTRALIAALLARGYQVAVPRLLGPGSMEAALLPSLDALVPGAHRVPTSAGPRCQQVGLALVPGLAFDRAGGRLGYGGGYYDRFLAARPGLTALGLGYDGQLVADVPSERWDVRLQGVITPSAWLSF